MRKQKSDAMNSIHILEAEVKKLNNKQKYVMGPIRSRLQQSIQNLKLTDEVYFKDTTLVGNTVHKIFKAFRKGNYELLECFNQFPDMHKKFEDCWLSLTDIDTHLTKPGKKTLAMREECAVACEKFCKIFPMHFDRPLRRKMHSLSLVLPWYVRQRGLYYEFLCLEQAGERAHCMLNEAERVYANVQPQENRYFLMVKYLKNRDRSDLSVVQPVPRKKNKSLL